MYYWDEEGMILFQLMHIVHLIIITEAKYVPSAYIRFNFMLLYCSKIDWGDSLFYALCILVFLYLQRLSPPLTSTKERSWICWRSSQKTAIMNRGWTRPAWSTWRKKTSEVFGLQGLLQRLIKWGFRSECECNKSLQKCFRSWNLLWIYCIINVWFSDVYSNS